MFNHIFSSIAKALSTAFLSLSMLFGGQASPDVTLGAAIQSAADFRSSLTSGITAVATTMTLVSTSTASGEVLTQGKTYGFKLGGREYVLGTLSAGKQITSMTRGVSLITGTTTGGVAEAWGRGTAVEITDAPILLQISNKISGTEYFDNLLTYASALAFSTSSNQLASTLFVSGAANTASTSAFRSILDGANTFGGLQTFTALPRSDATPTLGNELATKTYVDGVAIAGAPNADTTTKGVVEEATAAEIFAGTQTGGTGAQLFVNPSLLLNSGLRLINSMTATSTGTTTVGVNTYPFSTTTAVVASKTYLILASIAPGDNACNNDVKYGLFLKRPAVATTTLQYLMCDLGSANTGINLPVVSLYVAPASETVEIYFGNVNGNYNIANNATLVIIGFAN